MTKYFWLVFFFLSVNAVSQNFDGNQERFPRFEECENVLFEEEEACFNRTLKNKLMEEFVLPQEVSDSEYQGELVVLFEVTEEGDFETIYVDAMFEELEAEVERLQSAIVMVHRELQGLWKDLSPDAPAELGAFIDVHALILGRAQTGIQAFF